MADQSPAAASQVWTTQVARVGREGLDLTKSLDELTPQQVSRLSNLLWPTGVGDAITRLGQTLLANLSGVVHSIRRLNDPQNSTFTRFWGAGTSWYRGQSGAVAALSSGFSGDPLTLVTVRPPFSGEPWMLVADRSRMRKASRTIAADLPVGLPAPTSVTTAVNAQLKTPIAAFNATDGTQASAWTAYGTLDLGVNAPLSASPTLADGIGVVGNGLVISTVPTGVPAGTAYYTAAFLPKVLNLSVLPGAIVAVDEDIIHIRLRLGQPEWTEEVRLYLVCSPFSNAAVPGTAPLADSSAYMRAFRPSDYTDYVLGGLTAQQAAQTLRANELLEGYVQPGRTDADLPSIPTLLGRNTWSEFGAVDVPLRRSDFVKIGAAGQPGTDWSTITGVVILIKTTTNAPVLVVFNDSYLTGGYGPDSTEPASTPYDYRVVNYDPRTGARSNGTATQADTLALDAVRQSLTISPAAYTDSAVRQEAYRRGGSLSDNWRFIARNTANGGAIVDTLADADIATADTLPVDHFQPVATVDANGATVLNQPVPVVFGPFDDGTVCALGDPYRPGHLYASLPGEPDHWPSTGNFAIEVCSPAEELMNGCIVGGQGFVLSREQGYTVHTNLTAGGEGIVATPSGCTPGLAARWGFTPGPGGVYYVARDGVRVTNGGDSILLSQALWPLFHKETKYGLLPIDWAVPTAIRLAIVDADLWFLYQDTGGTRRCFLMSLLTRTWRPYTFLRQLATVYQDETRSEQGTQGALQCLFGATNGNAYTHSGFTDDGTLIGWSLRTGAWNFGREREDKLLGEVVVEADLQGTQLSLTTYLNAELVTNNPQTVTGTAGRRRYLFTPFDTSSAGPQHARSVSLELSGTAPSTAQVSLALAGVAYLVHPDVTMQRVTSWEPLGETETYVYGCCLDCDTGGVAITVVVECDLAGAITTAATLTVTSSGRHKLWFSWAAVHAQLIRLRPTDGCAPWMIFNATYLQQAEPPRIAGWDTNYESPGDTYYTGLDLQVDTFNVAKTVDCYADNVLIATKTVTGNGPTWVHLTFTPGRAHIYHLHATDANPGLLYSHKWILVAEPGEQTNWNAPYTVYSSLSDKYLKGLIIEADTFGQAKTVSVEVDGAAVATMTPVTHNGRLVKNYTFPQVLGRVFRIIPTDAFPSRLYTAQPIFDEEPFALGRWETQLLDLDLPGAGWGSVLSADVALKSTNSVVLSLAIYDAVGRLLQTVFGVDAQTGQNVITTTGGAKQKRYVTFPANKGVLFKFVFTTNEGSPITLYQEESRLRVQPWSGDGVIQRVFGNSNLDRTRAMVHAEAAAARSGGGT